MVELAQRFHFAFEFEQKVSARANETQVQFSVLSGDYTLHITPIKIATSEGFVDNKVLRRARSEGLVLRPRPGRRSLDAAFLEWERPQGDVHADAAAGLNKQDAVLESELSCVCPTRRKGGKQAVNELFLTPKSSKQCEIGILSHTRLAPPLNGHATNKAKAPFSLLAKVLNLAGGFEHAQHVNHARLL
jgi:hypothetical protein